MPSLREILVTAPLFSGLQEAERVALAGAMRPRMLKKGAALFRQGQSGDSLTIVTDGELSVRCEEDDGRQVEVARVGPGEVVGEMSCLDPAPRSATVAALTDTAQVFVLDRTMFDALFTNAPSLAVALIDGIAGALTERLRYTNDRIRRATQGDATREADPVSVPRNLPSAAAGTPYGRPLDLSKVPSLSHFTAAELERMAQVAPPMIYRNGEYLCREGDRGDALYIIGGGKVDVVKELEGGQKTLATLDKGAFVGQLALLDEAPRSASIRANGDAGVLAIGRANFRQMLRAHDSLALKLHEQITVAGIRQLRMANVQITRLLAELPPPPKTAARAPSAEPVHRASIRPERSERPDRPGPATRPRPPQRARPTNRPEPREQKVPAWRAMVDRGRAALGAPQPKRPVDWTSESRPPSQTKRSLGAQTYISTALNEWGLSLEDLDSIEVVIPEGQMSQAELKGRRGG